MQNSFYHAIDITGNMPFIKNSKYKNSFLHASITVNLMICDLCVKIYSPMITPNIRIEQNKLYKYLFFIKIVYDAWKSRTSNMSNGRIQSILTIVNKIDFYKNKFYKFFMIFFNGNMMINQVPKILCLDDLCMVFLLKIYMKGSISTSFFEFKILIIKK